MPRYNVYLHVVRAVLVQTTFDFVIAATLSASNRNSKSESLVQEVIGVSWRGKCWLVREFMREVLWWRRQLVGWLVCWFAGLLVTWLSY